MQVVLPRTYYDMNLTSFFKVFTTLSILAMLVTGCSEEGRTLLQVGEKAPPFTLTLIDGKQIQLDQYAGKGLIITFMSSWCPCSNDSIPLIKEAYLKHKGDNVAFLMIGIQDAESKFEKFVEKWDVPFPAGYDEDEKIARDYGISSPPTTIFINSSGIVKRAFYGNIADKKQEFPQWVGEIL